MITPERLAVMRARADEFRREPSAPPPDEIVMDIAADLFALLDAYEALQRSIMGARGEWLYCSVHDDFTCTMFCKRALVEAGVLAKDAP